MKKLFIGLLIIAAGAGAYYYFLQKKKTGNNNTIQKELLTGQWKINSFESKGKDSSSSLVELIVVLDSNLTKYRYDFRKDGNVLKSIADSAKADTAHYEWTKKNELAWKENPADSSVEILMVTKLNRDSLLLLSKDSVLIVFTKLK